MMLYGFLLTLYIINCLFLIIIILMQKGKSSLGIGAFGGGTQMIFGGGGGQDIFQKITWVLGTIFLIGSLVLSLLRHKEMKEFRYIKTKPAVEASSYVKTPADNTANETSAQNQSK